MKKSLLFLFACLFVSALQAQKKDSVYLKPADAAAGEHKPVYPGGDKEMANFIAKNLKSPRPKNYQWTSFITFVVEKDGSVSEVKVLRGAADCPEYDAEAMRVVSSMPAWEPGSRITSLCVCR